MSADYKKSVVYSQSVFSAEGLSKSKLKLLCHYYVSRIEHFTIPDKECFEDEPFSFKKSEHS